MKTRVLAIACSSICLLSASIASSDSSSKLPSPTTIEIPESLDALYPPRSTRPAFLQAMHELNIALTGIVVDVTENDHEGAAARCEEFAAHYLDISFMVPEWESLYPQEPVEALRTAVSGGDPGAVMDAVGKVGAVCHDCHVATMVPVQQRYHWPAFSQVMVQDPVSGNSVPFAPFMQMLNTSMVGIGVDLKEGDPDRARTHLAAFRSRMQGLRDSCAACHESERRYFVDEDIELLLSGLGAALDVQTVDASSIDHLTRRVGEEACSRCHLVHMPAAYARAGGH